MILAALCLLTNLQGPVAAAQTPAPQTASALISKMFQRYASAKSVSGRITLLQTALTASVEVDTAVAYERPNLLYVDQKRTDGTVPESTIISNGVIFSYTPPRDVAGLYPSKLIEKVDKGAGNVETVATMYQAGWLMDRTTPLSIVIARTPDLKVTAEELASYSLKGKVDVGGRQANWITGQWRQNRRHIVSALFDMYIDDDGNLVRYVYKVRERLSDNYLIHHHIPIGTYKDGVEIVSTWDVNVTVDQPVNHALFKL